MLKKISHSKIMLFAAISVIAVSVAGCGAKQTEEDVDDSKTVHYGETLKDGDIEISYGVNDDEDKQLSPDEQIEIKLAALDGAPALSLVNLMDRNAAGLTNEKYKTEIVSTTEEISDKLTKGEIDAAALPLNTAAKLYNSTNGGVRAIAITSLSNLYIAENGSSVSSFEDLAGKTLYVPGEDSLAAYVMEALLKKAEITDCTIEYKANDTELANSLIDGSVSLAVISQPILGKVQGKNSAVNLAVDLTDEWSEVADSDLVTSVIVVTNDFITNHYDAVEYLLGDCRSSANLTNHKSDETAALAVQYGLFDDEAAAKSSIRSSMINYYDGQKILNMIATTCNTLAQYNTDSVGGKAPDAAFCYIGDDNQ
jgi:NitT/TauT family transport system substrate-binding protein